MSRKRGFDNGARQSERLKKRRVGTSFVRLLTREDSGLCVTRLRDVDQQPGSHKTVEVCMDIERGDWLSLRRDLLPLNQASDAHLSSFTLKRAQLLPEYCQTMTLTMCYGDTRNCICRRAANDEPSLAAAHSIAVHQYTRKDLAPLVDGDTALLDALCELLADINRTLDLFYRSSPQHAQLDANIDASDEDRVAVVFEELYLLPATLCRLVSRAVPLFDILYCPDSGEVQFVLLSPAERKTSPQLRLIM